MSDLAATLAQRGSRYGSFEGHSEITQLLKDALFDHLAKTYNGHVEPYIYEALEMIAHKLGRIVNGDPYYDDSWRDIAGYAQLVVNIVTNPSFTDPNKS